MFALDVGSVVVSRVLAAQTPVTEAVSNDLPASSRAVDQPADATDNHTGSGGTGGPDEPVRSRPMADARKEIPSAPEGPD